MNRGDTNQRGQRLLRMTDSPGSDHNAKIWVMKCGRCGHVYGCNSTDAWERKCPKCQRGKPGLAVPVARDGEKWSREELVIAFNLYNQIPFGTIHMRNPKVIELAAILGRSVGSVSYKLSNFARLDPALQARGIRGASHGSKLDEEVWKEFVGHPETVAYESARLLAQHIGQTVEQVADIQGTDLPPPGEEREAIVRQRVNQSFFRRRVISAYGFRCCITGLAVPELLVASHIVPWAEDAANRLNPRNGLCLNSLHDRAFDRRLMWVDDGYVVRFSPTLRHETSASDTALGWVLSFDGKPLQLPDNFRPDSDFLIQHAQKCRSQ